SPAASPRSSTSGQVVGGILSHHAFAYPHRGREIDLMERQGVAAGWQVLKQTIGDVRVGNIMEWAAALAFYGAGSRLGCG
ncbi:MAG TPA: hypothetical protein VK356_11830, partial [Thermomicrobiales bacterium]|nr:hypothetical protein [Thermomicrobiales bacterium]